MLTKIKSAACTVGNGLGDLAVSMHNTSLRDQITELDSQAEALRKQLKVIEDQKSDLKKRLI